MGFNVRHEPGIVSQQSKDQQGYKLRLTTGARMYYDRVYVLIANGKEE